MPDCTGQETLAAVQEAGLDTPFLIVSATMGEEAAVAAMQAGAADCLTKQKLARLIPVVDALELPPKAISGKKGPRKLALQPIENADRLRSPTSDVAQDHGTFEWDMVADHMRFDDRASVILGLPAGSAVHKYEAAFQLIHPLDRALIEASLAQSIAGADPQTREFRIVRPDGRTRWIASRGIIERDAQGQAARLIGVLQDIHDLKSTEEKLWAQTERLHYLSRQLLSAQEGERRKIARELHDEIGQSLTAAIITLQMMQKQPAASCLAGDLREGAALLDATLQQVRAAVGSITSSHA